MDFGAKPHVQGERCFDCNVVHMKGPICTHCQPKSNHVTLATTVLSESYWLCPGCGRLVPRTLSEVAWEAVKDTTTVAAAKSGLVQAGWREGQNGWYYPPSRHRRLIGSVRPDGRIGRSPTMHLDIQYK